MTVERLVPTLALALAVTGCSGEAPRTTPAGAEQAEARAGHATARPGHARQRAGHDEPAGAEDPAAPGAGDDAVLGAYLNIHKALAADTADGVAEAAGALAEAAEPHRSHGGAHAEVAGGLTAAAGRFESADLAASREAFKALSQQMVRYRGLMPAVRSATVVVHCPMANADWVQTAEVVQNPYHGREMPRCGSVTKRRGDA